MDDGLDYTVGGIVMHAGRHGSASIVHAGDCYRLDAIEVDNHNYSAAVACVTAMLLMRGLASIQSGLILQRFGRLVYGDLALGRGD